MINRPVARFVCSASPEVGGGHVIRCQALADQLVELGWHAAFHVNEQAPDTVPALRDGRFELSSDKDINECSLIVVDDYSKDVTLESELRQHANTVMVIDDLADRPHDCDILLDQTLGRQSDDYSDKAPSDCRFLLGTEYALLRPDFKTMRLQAVTRNKVSRVLIAPGQTDPHNLSQLILNAVNRALPETMIDVVLGSSAPNLELIQSGLPKSATLHIDINGDEMAKLMIAADLAIGAAGGSSWERCVLGLPSLVVVVADNQRTNAAALAQAGAACVVGDLTTVSIDSLADAIEVLANDEVALTSMSRNAASLCDGRGTLRTAVAIIPQQSTNNGEPLRLRIVEKSDAQHLFDWQCEPSTRRYSRNPTPPSWDEHRSWLDGKVDDVSCLFCIVETDDGPVGYIRLDRIEEGYEISISTAPGFRRMGIAESALRFARDLLPVDNILAYIKTENEASLNLFQAAGYVPAESGYFIQSPGSR